MKPKLSLGILVSVLLSAVMFSLHPRLTVTAAQTITVNSNADTQSDDGVCTLREAITAANTNTASGSTPGECIAGDAGSDTINFIITGTADFTNNGQDGYTITPSSALPALTDAVIIDGYSQPGAQANVAIAPNPLNGTLLIELDGSGTVLDSNGLELNADDITVRGLVINNWTNDGLGVNGDNITIHGNYIGTNPEGTTAQPNANIGVAGWGPGGNGALLGGITPESRNLISGNGTNPQGSGIGMGPNHNDWQIKGNYIGLAADGVNVIPNAQLGGSGNPSIDFVSGTVVGGLETGAINVISGNLGHGIAPFDAPETTIQGNYIGTNYTGTVALGNSGSGITINESENSLIDGNIVAHNGNTGIFIADDTSVTVSDNQVLSNGNGGVGLSATADVNIIDNLFENNVNEGIYMNTAGSVVIEGNQVTDNTTNGIAMTNSNGITIGGDTTGAGNIITGSAQSGIHVFGSSSDVSVYGNVVEDSTDRGIYLQNSSEIAIGGTAPGAGNNVAQSGTEGIYSDTVTDVVIDGNVVEDNGFVGIVITSGSTGNAISKNQVARNLGTGINIAGGSTNNILTGNEVFDNSTGGINIDNSSDNVIGGSTASDRNIIFGHASSNINISGFGGVSNGNIVQGNFVGVAANGQLDSGISQSSGVSLTGSAQYNLIGGTGSGEGNRIIGNTVSGIQSTGITITGLGSFTPSSNTLIGNSVYGNEEGSSNGFGAPGLGIELLNINVDGSFVPQSSDNLGPDVNDTTDSDTGTNNYMNYPVINSASQNLLELDIGFDLDAADSPSDQYRVEFFANDSADPSGYGEGQTYLGSTTLSPGSGQVANLALPAGTNLTGKVLSATTTAVDGTTDSGFGSTSEFSLVSDIDIIALPQEANSTEGGLANTGQNITALFAIAAGLWGLSVAVAKRQYRSYSLDK